MNKLTIVAGAFAAALMTTSGAASAADYDAFSSFNGTNGAGGFTYGVYNGSFTNFTQTTNCVIGNTICLQSGTNTVPGAYKTANGSTSTDGTVLVPSNALLLHPGFNNDQTFALFTAPVAGAYTFSGIFTHQDTSPSGVTISSFSTINGATVFLSQDEFPGAFDEYQSSTLGTIALSAGDSLGFLVGNGGDLSNDSTGVNFTVHTDALVPGAVPEPATWAMMLIGFGMVGFGLRSRRKATVRVTYA